MVDDTGYLTYDMANPGFYVQGDNTEPFYYADLPNSAVPVSYNGMNFINNGSLGLLLAHMHNGSGNHSEVVGFAEPTISSFSPLAGPVGTQVTILGSNFGPGTTVTFFKNKPAVPVTVLSNTTILVNVPAGATTGTIQVGNAAGNDSTRIKFRVTP